MDSTRLIDVRLTVDQAQYLAEAITNRAIELRDPEMAAVAVDFLVATAVQGVTGAAHLCAAQLNSIAER